MVHRRLLVCAAVAGIAVSMLLFWNWPRPAASFSNQVLQVGSSGDDVYELQGRLQHLGYYTGKIDGQFGWQTYWAVRNFQYQFGIKVDGVVGPQTKQKLVKATPNWTPSMNRGTGGGSNQAPAIASASGFSNSDINLMARAVYGEARGEPYEGQVAVAAVILNRIKSPLFPNTISGVIYQTGAFTAVADGQINMQPNETAFRAVRDALNGWDPSEGAIYYFNPDTATSAWIWSRPQIKRIGKHIFCK